MEEPENCNRNGEGYISEIPQQKSVNQLLGQPDPTKCFHTEGGFMTSNIPFQQPFPHQESVLNNPMQMNGQQLFPHQERILNTPMQPNGQQQPGLQQTAAAGAGFNPGFANPMMFPPMMPYLPPPPSFDFKTIGTREIAVAQAQYLWKIFEFLQPHQVAAMYTQQAQSQMVNRGMNLANVKPFSGQDHQQPHNMANQQRDVKPFSGQDLQQPHHMATQQQPETVQQQPKAKDSQTEKQIHQTDYGNQKQPNETLDLQTQHQNDKQLEGKITQENVHPSAEMHGQEISDMNNNNLANGNQNVCMTDTENPVTLENFTDAQESSRELNPKRRKINFTMYQIVEMEKEFQTDMFSTRAKKLRLAERLGLEEKQVKIWFQNRRMKHRKDPVVSSQMLTSNGELAKGGRRGRPSKYFPQQDDPNNN